MPMTYDKEKRNGLEVFIALKRKDITFADVGRKLGCTRVAVHNAVNGKSNSQRILDEIYRLGVPAKLLGAKK